MHQPGEPSVEEILDSIKKVIARDNREGAIAQRRERSQSAARPSAARSEPIEPVDAEEADALMEELDCVPVHDTRQAGRVLGKGWRSK